MSRPLRIEFSGAVYHVTSRGDRRGPIYRDDEDRTTQLEVIDYAMDRLDGQVLAYCQDGQSLSFGAAQRQANLSRLMRHVSGVCTRARAFNRGHGLVGHLFQGRFKAILVDRDAYLLALCRHVERNPVAAGTGFRAPSLWDVNSPPAFTNTANSLVDPDCPAGFAGDPRCETQFNVRNSSTPGLKPEKSRQVSAGIVLEPMKDLSASLDYWEISKSNQIDSIGGDAMLTDAALYARYKSRIRRTADGFISYIETPVDNLGGLRTAGIDLNVKAAWTLAGLGRLGLELDGTYITRWTRQNGKDGPYVSYLGTAGDGATVQPVPRWQHTLVFDWTSGAWGARLENQFVKGWTEPAALVDANIGVATDYHVKNSDRWNLSGAYTGVKNLTLRLGVKNLFDSAPPFTASSSYGSHAAGYAASFTDPRGRNYYAAASYKF